MEFDERQNVVDALERAMIELKVTQIECVEDVGVEDHLITATIPCKQRLQVKIEVNTFVKLLIVVVTKRTEIIHMCQFNQIHFFIRSFDNLFS